MGIVFKKGKLLKRLKEEEIVDGFTEEIFRFVEENRKKKKAQ
jgi:4-hydroxy-3-methylbut-2-en-1-yl diphosphate synthase IspG/GcpE